MANPEPRSSEHATSSELKSGATTRELTVWLTAFGAEPTRATAIVLQQSAGQRATRALTILGGVWGAAGLAVFIPIAHFVLVPGLLVLGLVLAVLRLREDQRLAYAEGVCPRCGSQARFEAGGRLTAERSIDCPRCHTALRLVIESRGAL